MAVNPAALLGRLWNGCATGGRETFDGRFGVEYLCQQQASCHQPGSADALAAM
jgi:hypothetical protein